MELFDDLVGKWKAKKSKSVPVVKEGRTWQQIAMWFVREVKPKFDEFPEGFAMAGKTLRNAVGDPNNTRFRRMCKDNGVRILKTKNQDIYTITRYNIVEERLKKSENTGMF